MILRFGSNQQLPLRHINLKTSEITTENNKGVHKNELQLLESNYEYKLDAWILCSTFPYDIFEFILLKEIYFVFTE